MPYYNRKEYYNKTQLKERGWTESIIKKLLKDIEPIEFWGVYKSVPQKCYLISLVEEIEKTDEFKEYYEKAKTRKEIGKKTAELKRNKNIEKLKQHLKSITIEVIKDDNKLWEETFNDKMEWYECCGNWESISDKNSINQETKERWIVNYIRHNLTNYDDYCYAIYSKVGVGEMYCILHEYVLTEIGKLYPRYKNECIKQINRMKKECV